MKDMKVGEVSFGPQKSVVLRDGRVAELSRIQKMHDDMRIYGECTAVLEGEKVGWCLYSMKGKASAHIIEINVNENVRLNGVGSAMLNYVTIDMLNQGHSVIATSDYKDYIARFMRKNAYEVRPFRRSDRVDYNFYAKNKEQVDKVLEWADNLARVPKDDLEEFGFQ